MNVNLIQPCYRLTGVTESTKPKNWKRQSIRRYSTIKYSSIKFRDTWATISQSRCSRREKEEEVYLLCDTINKNILQKTKNKLNRISNCSTKEKFKKLLKKKNYFTMTTKQKKNNYFHKFMNLILPRISLHKHTYTLSLTTTTKHVFINECLYLVREQSLSKLYLFCHFFQVN